MPAAPAPDLTFEISLWSAGTRKIAGVDEAGRGAWAGPVSAGAVILPDDAMITDQLKGVRDSKQMPPRQREYWAEIIQHQAAAWAVGFASNQEIDQLGILPATRLAMGRALALLPTPPQHLLIDAVRLPSEAQPQTILIKGDQRSLSIAAASILAKTARDAFMTDLARQFPVYGFSQHKGYGTALHLARLQQNGACRFHRSSFAPIKNLQTCYNLKEDQVNDLSGEIVE